MLIEEIKKANITAMKEHDVDGRAALSMIITAYQNLVTSGPEVKPTDADVIHIIQKFAKELDEEKEGYIKLGRHDSATAIERQKAAVAKFLPKMLSEAEIKKIISTLTDKSIPAVMKHFKDNYAGQCDMGLVSRLARGL